MLEAVKLKKVKQKGEKKTPENTAKVAAVTPAPAVQQQFIIQQPQQQIKVKNEPQQQQIILSMSQAQTMLQQPQLQKGAVYTFPTNLILNTNGQFVTPTGEVVGIKFNNQ